jgi:hypothetical protein
VKLVPPIVHDQPELIMMTTKSPLLTKLSRSLSIACLALAFTTGISAVRAQSEAPWRDMFVDPIMDAVQALEDRLTGLEAKVASVGSPQSAAHELCVADDAGARTCISKAQLDRLLKMMQTAAIEPPASVNDTVTTNVTESVTEPAKAESIEAAPAPAAPAIETQAAVVEEAAQIETTTATVVEAPRQSEQAALAQDTLDPTPTGSIPAPAQGEALVTQPEVEITTPSREH